MYRLPVATVKIGSAAQGHHPFLCIELRRQPRNSEIRSIHAILRKHCKSSGSCIACAFVDKEIQIQPETQTPISGYKKILRILGFWKHNDKLVVDGNLRSFDERQRFATALPTSIRLC